MADVILSLDPSSTRSGWAVMQPPERLLQAGLLLPEKTKAASEARIETMCRDLRELLEESQPAVVVIEWTSGKVNVKRHKGEGAGLAVHGAATGALWREIEGWKRSLSADRRGRTLITLVRENEWTRGVSKQDRQATVAASFSAYDPSQDPGADIADAIALAGWFQREQMTKMLEEVS